MAKSRPVSNQKATPRKPANAQGEPEIVGIKPDQFPLTRINFYIMAAAVVLIVVGFLLMLGGSTTTEAFNPDIFSTRRIVVAPTIAFIGFLVMGFGIVYRPRRKSDAVVEREEKNA